VTRSACLAACVALGGCSGLTEEGGVAGLELLVPRPAEVEVGQTVTVTARALDGSGNEVDAPIVWGTPDTTLIVTTDGQITGRTGGSTGRVQAQAGALASDFVTFTVRPRPDTLVLSADSVLTVAADAPASAALVATLRSFAPDQPVSGGTIVYSVASPVFADPAGRTVELNGGVLTLSATTGGDGTPATPVVLSRVAGHPAPAIAVVTVSAATAVGTPVPGSGQRFRVEFQ
jgi:hypothetical protein